MNMLTAIAQGSSYGDVRQTLNSVLGRTFDVRLYGAAGDGTTNDTAAIDAAITALTTAGGGMLFFPPGAYLYTKPRFRLTTSNTWLSGPGATLLFNCVSYQGSVAAWLGRVLFDGGYSSGTIGNVGVIGDGLTIQDTSGHDFSADTMNDPLGNLPYSSMVCCLALRGCADFLVMGGRYLNAAGWSIHPVRCSDGIITRTNIHGAIADGIHPDYGCTNLAIVDNDINNVGDDMIAVGFTGPACTGIHIAGNRGRTIGGKMVAIYGAESGKTDEITAENNEVDGTYLSGMALVALAYGGSGSSTKAGPIGTFRARGGSIRNAGMVGGTSRGVDEAHGIMIQPAGSTIDKVILQDMSISKNRNAYVFVKGSGLARLTMTGMDFDTQSATGAAAATSAGGQQNAPTNVSPVDVSAATLLAQISCVQDGVPLANVPSAVSASATPIATDTFTRANVSPGATALGTTETGSKAWNTASTGMGITSNKAYPAPSVSYPTALINAGASNVDMSIDVTVGGTPVYMFISAANNASNGIVLFSNGAGGLYADGSSPALAMTPSGQFASGTHTMRLKRNGTAVTAYIDGAQVGTLTLASNYQTTNTYVGFGVYGTSDGTERFDNFTVSAAS